MLLRHLIFKKNPGAMRLAAGANCHRMSIDDGLYTPEYSGPQSPPR